MKTNNLTKAVRLPSNRTAIMPAKPRRRIAQRPEQDFQIMVVETILKRLELAGKLSYAAFSNGFKRTLCEGLVAKKMGQRAGAWDIAIFLPGGRTFGLEMKATEKDRPSKAQSDFHARLAGLGFKTYVCATQQQVIAALSDQGIAL